MPPPLEPPEPPEPPDPDDPDDPDDEALEPLDPLEPFEPELDEELEAPADAGTVEEDVDEAERESVR